MSDSTPRGTELQITEWDASMASIVFPASIKQTEESEPQAAGVSINAIASAVLHSSGSVGECLTLTSGYRWRAQWPNKFVDLTKQG